MSQPALRSLVLMAVLGLGAALWLPSCQTNYCAEAPKCDGTTAINCTTACNVPPCSTGSHVHACADGTTCTVHPGDTTSLEYAEGRALCIPNDPDGGTCDPATAPAPTCDADGQIHGCSGYGVEIVAPCADATVYFDSAGCCLTPVDGGTGDGGTDGGTGDGGTHDAGS